MHRRSRRHYLGYISLSEVDADSLELFLATAERGLKTLKVKMELPVDRYATEMEIASLIYHWAEVIIALHADHPGILCSRRIL